MNEDRESAPGVDGPSPAPDVVERIIATAFSIASVRGWAKITLGEIAGEAGISLAEMRGVVSCKADILDLFLERIDRATIAEPPVGGSARDRLFDVIMRRFDALSPYRKGVKEILGDLAADPTIAISLLPGFWRSLAWMLEAAGLGAAGISGIARRKGLAAIYLNAFRVWLGDDTPAMERTMRALDSSLQQAERLIRLFQAGEEVPGSPPAAEPPPAS